MENNKVLEAALPPTEQELYELKEQIKEAKQKAEYGRLKQELQDITYKAVHTPTEFDGAMQIPDTDKVLKAKRNKYHFFDLFIERIKNMFSFRPIIGNVIALLLSMVALYYIFHEVDMAGFGKYRSYFAIGIQIFAAIQIIKSATRSLLLPILAMIVGGSIAHSIGAHELLLHFDKAFYEHLMITGIIGLGVAILTID